ncbi:MAG: ABC transporter ATP-binding protein, partial [Parasporobacterium sp.]|nr:ABC transporter ATP-binding protein [Parasporobacterium sp.]
MADYYFHMNHMTVGYNKKPLINDIEIGINKGEIITLIGPNGSGKSTILKSISRNLELVGGQVLLEDQQVTALSFKELSLKMAVMLTERIKTEYLTCYEIVATGRYPYTGRLGILSPEDEEIVEEALRRVHAEELGSRDFNAISDGQRQRILLARAICQQTEIILLDEPTSFLDIKHKLELLAILRSMAKEKNITVIMSLHEIDLAQKISDKVVCVKGDHISLFGEPEKIFTYDNIKDLYSIDNGSYDPVFGSIELPMPKGKPETFVIAGAGSGIPLFRKLQKENTPFIVGVLYTNDIDYELAQHLATEVITEKPFCNISEETLAKAKAAIDQCSRVIDAGVPIGDSNQVLSA